MREVSGDSLKIKSDTFSEMGKVSAETRKSIMEAKGKNMSIKDICKSHNLSKATVHRVLAGGPATSAVEGKSSGRSAPPTLFEATTIELSNILDDKPTNEMIQEEEKKQTKHTAQSLENLSEHLMDMPLENETEIIEKLSKPPRKSKAVGFSQSKPPADDDTEKHNQLEQRIILNVDNFAPLFHFIKDKEQFIKSLHNKSVWELEGILKTLETTRTTVNLSNQMKQSFFMASKGCEVFGGMFLSLKLQGLTDGFIQQQQELDMIFREIAIEYAPMFKITAKPELRLLMMFAMTAVQTDSSNRLKEALKAQNAMRMSNPLSPNVESQIPEPSTVDKFADL